MTIMLLLHLSIMLFCLFSSMESGRGLYPMFAHMGHISHTMILLFQCHTQNVLAVYSNLNNKYLLFIITLPSAINSQNILGVTFFQDIRLLVSHYSWQFFKWLMVQALKIQILCLGNAVIFLCLRVITQRFASKGSLTSDAFLYLQACSGHGVSPLKLWKQSNTLN